MFSNIFFFFIFTDKGSWLMRTLLNKITGSESKLWIECPQKVVFFVFVFSKLDIVGATPRVACAGK